MNAAPGPVARREVVEIGVLLVADLVFLLVVVPLGIEDPTGLGLGEGLPPSFSANLVSILVGVILVGRLLQLVTGWGYDSRAIDLEMTLEAPEGARERLQFSLIGMFAALLFAFVLVPALGFHLGAWLFLLCLLAVLGETRRLHLIVLPPVVVLLVWGLFDQLLSIRLPGGVLFNG